MTELDLTNYAVHLGVRWLEMRNAPPRTKQLSNAKAYFEGLCAAGFALGLAMTPFAIELAVMDAYDATVQNKGERPAFEPAQNLGRKTWDKKFAANIIDRLEDL